MDWTRDVFLSLIPLMLLTSMAIVHSIFYKEPLLGFVLTAIPTAIGLCMKARPSIWLLALLILCWAGLLVLSAVQRPESQRQRGPLYIQSDENSSLPYVFLGTALVLVLGYVLIFSGNSYRPPETVDDAKEAIISLQEHIRYDKLGGEKIDELKQGDLTHGFHFRSPPIKMRV